VSCHCQLITSGQLPAGTGTVVGVGVGTSVGVGVGASVAVGVGVGVRAAVGVGVAGALVAGADVGGVAGGFVSGGALGTNANVGAAVGVVRATWVGVTVVCVGAVVGRVVAVGAVCARCVVCAGCALGAPCVAFAAAAGDAWPGTVVLGATTADANGVTIASTARTAARRRKRIAREPLENEAIAKNSRAAVTAMASAASVDISGNISSSKPDRIASTPSRHT
jgi:hypothetical protein